MDTISQAVEAQQAQVEAANMAGSSSRSQPGPQLPSADTGMARAGLGFAGAAQTAVRLRSIRSETGKAKFQPQDGSAIARAAALHEQEEESALKRQSSGLWGAVRGVWGAVRGGFGSG